jgi:hypothetical protein
MYRFDVILADAITIAETVVQKMKEAQEKTEEQTIVVSEASQSKAQLLLNRIEAYLAEGNFPTDEALDIGTTFDWQGRNEPNGTPDACTFIKSELAKCGLRLQPGGYKVVDVHTSRNLLNIEEKKLAKYQEVAILS